MEYRSTNADGAFVHFGGALIAGVNFGSGVELNPNSSGSAPRIQPCGDESNKGIVLRGKGTGTVTVADSSQAINLAGNAVTVGAGSAIKGIYSTTFAFTFAAISSGQNSAEITVSTAIGDLAPGDIYSFEVGALNTTNTAVTSWRTSTAASSRLTVVLGNISSTATSTGSGTLTVSWIDIT